ncbi:MAG: ATP-dependent Clp protease ATP-binding subunit [Candidatus Marinimicrobia bacterium]|nr:ATP-dependent Clp protease ATP-binding subunit [Candidatus Neomarinimicrobiota bacterium]
MIIFKYIAWHYSQALKYFFSIWGNFIKFFWLYFFPIPTLLKTLFKPWKRTGYKIKQSGFDIKTIAENFSVSFASRFAGACVKTITILIVIIFELCLLYLGTLFLLFWITWPILLISAFIAKQLIISVLLFLPGILFLSFYKLSKETSPDQLSITDIFKKKWANGLSDKLGLVNGFPKEVLKNPTENIDPFLKEQNIKKEDFETALSWEISNRVGKYTEKRFWLKENLFSRVRFGGDWIYGYTPELNQYIAPLVSLRKYEHFIGREEKINHLENILSRDKQSNALIIGEPGVGKMSLVQHFTRLSQARKTSPALFGKRTVLLSINQALAGIKTKGEIEQKLLNLLNQIKHAGNVILVINDFHNLPDASLRILNPFLREGQFQLIAITTYKGLHEKIQKQEDLMGFFEKIEIPELDKETTKQVCMDSARQIEKRNAVKITVQAINEIINKAETFITDVPFPEKALDLLEETAIYVSQQGNTTFVTPKDVNAVISRKTEIPVGDLEAGEKEKLANLENIIHERVINQNQAVEEISSAMRRTRMGVSTKNRPIGSFLFLGPTGVGKTETAKALAEIYFGSEDRINRFDMSEFQGSDAIPKMIGSTQTNKPGLLTTAVKENPFSLLLLDEIEKADSNVLNLFLQILEDGWLTNAFGKKINFRNQIIIATSNAGAEFIRTKAEQGFKSEEIKKEFLDHILKQNIFRPEFINRFDETVIFKPLTPDNLIKISELMLSGLAKRLSEKEIIFNFSEPLIKKIAELGYDPANGARPMRRVIQQKIENLIAQKMLKDEFVKNTPFEITVDQI